MTPEQKQRLEAIKNEVCKELTGSPACDLIPMVWNPALVDQIALRFAEAEKQLIAKEIVAWRDLKQSALDHIRKDGFNGNSVMDYEIQTMNDVIIFLKNGPPKKTD